MSKAIFGKTLAECKNYQLTTVKENTNKNGEHNKFITLNTEPGNRETAINVYLSKTLSKLLEVGHQWTKDDVKKFTVTEMVDEETGESWPLLTSGSTYRSIADILAED